MKPKRIKRERTRGWKMPLNSVYVGRPTKWGNPWKISERDGMTREQAVANYREEQERLNRLSGGRHYDQIREELSGKDLACWCTPDQVCHADILLEIANS